MSELRAALYRYHVPWLQRKFPQKTAEEIARDVDDVIAWLAKGPHYGSVPPR